MGLFSDKVVSTQKISCRGPPNLELKVDAVDVIIKIFDEGSYSILCPHFKKYYEWGGQGGVGRVCSAGNSTGKQEDMPNCVYSVGKTYSKL